MLRFKSQSVLQRLTIFTAGYGCERYKETKSNYPKVKTHYSDQFELDYEVVFTYSKADSGRPEDPMDPIGSINGSINGSDCARREGRAQSESHGNVFQQNVSQ